VATLLALAALGRRPWCVAVGMLLLAATFVALLLFPDNRDSAWPVEPRRGAGQTRPLFQTWGTVLAILMALVILRLLLRLRPRSVGFRLRRPAARLLVWLALDLAGSAVLTPFPAARRVMGTIVVATLLTAHLAARTCRRPRGRARLWLAAA